ncbi:MAG: class I SAM-dependent methyltransferase, partial [Spirochaetaceae bacterium]
RGCLPVTRRTRGCLLPTLRGRRYLETAVEEYYLERGLVESARSSAFRDLCRARQGLEVVQHGSLTGAQLSAVCERVRMLRPRSVLDLGCGVGEVGTVVAARTGARLFGVDRSASAISHARESGYPGAAFLRADMETYVESAPRGSVDLVLAIDALYWIDDMRSVLSDVIEILAPGGRLLCVSSEFDESRSGGEPCAPEETEVGAALEELSRERTDLHVETLDFTDEERSLWLGSLSLCDEWEEAFAAEGRAYLLRNIVREAEFLEKAMRNGRGGRFLYVVSRAGGAPMSER